MSLGVKGLSDSINKIKCRKIISFENCESRKFRTIRYQSSQRNTAK